MHIQLAHKFVHLVAYCVQVVHRKLLVRLYLGKQSPGEHLIAPFSDSQGDDYSLEVLLCEAFRLLAHRVKEGDDKCKFEFFPKVFELLTIWVADVETLREDSRNVHVMAPDQILHIVRQAYFCGQRVLAKDVVDLLVGCQGQPEDIFACASVQEIEG